MKNTRTIWIVAGIIIFFFLFAMPWSGRWGGMMGMMYPRYNNYDFGGMMGFSFGWIFMLLAIVTLVLFIAWLIQQLQQNNLKK